MDKKQRREGWGTRPRCSDDDGGCREQERMDSSITLVAVVRVASETYMTGGNEVAWRVVVGVGVSQAGGCSCNTQPAVTGRGLLHKSL